VLDALTKGYLSRYPAAAARTLSRLEDRDLAAIFEATPRQLGANVLQHMAPGSAARCLGQLQTGTAVDILARLPAATGAGVLRLLGRDQVKALLSGMPRPAAARLRLRLRYPDTVIGSFVNGEVLTLQPEHRVGDALRLLRRGSQRPGNTLYVLDERRHLMGVVELGDILGQRDRTLIQHLIRPAPLVLSARAALLTVANHPLWLTHDSLPVVDRAGVFQGVLPRSKVVEEEQQLLAGVADRNELSTTRAALADIFWLGMAALLTGGGAAPRHKEHD